MVMLVFVSQQNPSRDLTGRLIRMPSTFEGREAESPSMVCECQEREGVRVA